jgi:hypothetical protein
VARWSDVAEPDDPLRADDALVGAHHEDVLLGADPVDDDEPAPLPDELDEVPAPVAVLDDRPTTELPPVVVAPAPEPPGAWAGVAPWAVFAAVAVVVIAATTTWASWLQGPTAERQSFTGLIQPTFTASAPAPVEAAPAPDPDPEPEAEPQPDPQPAPERQQVARPTQRPRVTRPPATPPPAAAVNAPATPTGKPQGQSSAKTPAPSSAAAAAANADASDKDNEKESTAAKTKAPEKDNSDD